MTLCLAGCPRGFYPPSPPPHSNTAIPLKSLAVSLHGSTVWVFLWPWLFSRLYWPSVFSPGYSRMHWQGGSPLQHCEGPDNSRLCQLLSPLYTAVSSLSSAHLICPSPLNWCSHFLPACSPCLFYHRFVVQLERHSATFFSQVRKLDLLKHDYLCSFTYIA